MDYGSMTVTELQQESGRLQSLLGELETQVADLRAAFGKVREELLRRGIIDRNGPNPRQDFRRIKDALKARSVIAERDELLWPARAA